MHEPHTITESDLREAHQAAGTLVSEEFRPYLPGRLLPVLLAKFRDDVAERLGMDLPLLPQRPPLRAALPRTVGRPRWRAGCRGAGDRGDR